MGTMAAADFLMCVMGCGSRLAGACLAFLVVVFDVFACRGEFLVEGLDFAALVAYGSQQGVELFVLDGEGILLLHTHYEIGQDVHIVGEGLEWGFIGAEQ